MHKLKDNILEISNYKQRIYRLKKGYTIVNGTISEYPVIVHSYAGEIKKEVSIFSDFFYYKSTNRAINLLNDSMNTITKKYGRLLVMFLNYVFYGCEKPISRIEDVTIEMGQQFLQRYAKGLEGRKQSKSEYTVSGGEMTLTYFFYWLLHNYPVKPKYIKLSNFEWEEYYSINEGTKFREEKVKHRRLNSLFCVDADDEYVTRDKVVTGSLYMVLLLLDIAKKHDKMLRLGIALGAFAGLRKGEVCQMSKSRIKTFEPYVNVQFETTIDTTYNQILRSDGLMTGYIKTKKVRPVYEPFLPMLNDIYNDHLDMLNEDGLNNQYGALFIDSRGNAMTDYTYLDRFKKLTNIMRDVLRVAALEDEQENAKEAYSLLQGVAFTPHSLRYFFSQYICERENNPIVLQRYRVDKQIATQMGYILESRKAKERIKELQEELHKDAVEHMKNIEKLFDQEVRKYKGDRVWQE